MTAIFRALTNEYAVCATMQIDYMTRNNDDSNIYKMPRILPKNPESTVSSPCLATGKTETGHPGKHHLKFHNQTKVCVCVCIYIYIYRKSQISKRPHAPHPTTEPMALLDACMLLMASHDLLTNCYRPSHSGPRMEVNVVGVQVVPHAKTGTRGHGLLAVERQRSILCGYPFHIALK